MRTRRRITKKMVYDNGKKIIVPLLVIIFLTLIGIIIRYFVLRGRYNAEQLAIQAMAEEEKTKIELEYMKKDDENEVKETDDNLEEIDPSLRIEEITQTYELEYKTIYETDDTLPKGMIQVAQEGRTGLVEVIVKQIYREEELISEEQVSNKMLKVPIDKVVVTGTSKYKSNYKVKVGDTLYVASYNISVRTEKDVNSEKIITINQDEAVELLEISGDWYKIGYQMYEGYALADALTYIPPVQEYDGEEGLPKDELLSRLSFNMNINTPSGFSLEQFKKVLSNNESDVNKIIQLSAEYFYYAEKQYNVNGIFLASIAIHESGWGTSTIALNKKNLFGYGAADSNPYGNAYTYTNYSESIDLVARALVKYYLNPTGVKIYDGELASGVYYNGNTISDVNRRYASDKNWATKVYGYMQLLYNKL